MQATPMLQHRPELVDEATSPFVSQHDMRTEPKEPAYVAPKPIAKKPIIDSMEDEQEEQEIYAVSSAEESAHLLPKTGRSMPLTRVEKARLLNAGFDVILDEDGHRPFVVGPSLKDLKLNYSLEKADLRYNDISLNFMGLTFNAELFNHFGGNHYMDLIFLGYFPSSVYFSFQFYNYPFTTTERLHIYTGPLPASKRESDTAHHRSSSLPPSNKHVRQWSHVSQRSSRGYLPEDATEEEHLWPGILYSIEEDGVPACTFSFFKF
jgi:hypothetical protein